jgi:hypothetical protein
MSFGGDKIIVDSDPERKDSFKSRVQRQFSVTSLNDDDSTTEGQLYSMVDVDPALDAKMHIINNVCRTLVASCKKTLVTDCVLDDRRDWLDEPSFQALLPHRLWICRRLPNPSAAIGYSHFGSC